MIRHPTRVRDYLEHMLEALRRVAEFTAGMKRSDFMDSHLVQDAVMRNLGILGEAAKNYLTDLPSIPTLYPEIPFAQVYGLRNQLTHGYTTVDLDMVWEIVQDEAPELQKQIAIALTSLPDSLGTPANSTEG